jgi:tRNA(Met) cytidine acetyltransferase
LADAALVTLAQALRADALAAHQRRALVLAGPAAWTLEAVQTVLSGAPRGQGKTAWLTDRVPLDETHIPVTAGGHLLGTELDTLIYDAHCGLDPDGLGAALGALRGGGLLILLTPELDAWPGRPDPLADALAPPAVSGPARRPSRLIRRLVGVLTQAAGVTLVRAGMPPALSLSAPPPTPGALGATSAGANGPRTPDQRLAIEAILKAARGRGRRPLVLTSDRGRGKSAALGLAAAALLADGRARILVTAPRHAAVAPVFAHAGLALPQAHAVPGSLRQGGASLEFLPPDRLAQTQPAAHLLLVDEAAGIPAPLLEALLRAYPRIVFATTVHGYEGTGRGFEVRFRATLDRLTPGWRALTLTAPIRWADGDPIEALASSALLLDAVPAAGDDLAEAGPATCRFTRLDRDALVEDEARLRELFGLLVLAHYQTRPADLRHLLDGPGLRIYALIHRGHIAAAALGVREGGLDAALGAAIFAGCRRPRGHLLPQTLSAHAGIEEATDLSYLRLIRIAVHPAIQGRGLGRMLIAKVLTDAHGLGLDLLGASFGATAGLLGFWRRCGLPAVHIGTSRNAASGAHAAVVLTGLSPAGEALTQLARRRLGQRLGALFANPLRDLEPDIALALLSAAPLPGSAPDMDSRTWRELAAFAHAHRPVESVIAPLGGLAAAALSRDPGSLSDQEARVLVVAALQHRGLAAGAALSGASGRAEVVAVLRGATRALLRDLAPADLTAYVRDLTERAAGAASTA